MTSLGGKTVVSGRNLRSSLSKSVESVEQVGSGHCCAVVMCLICFCNSPHEIFHYQVGDTLRSARSVASVRSVTIHPRLSWTSLLCQHC